MLGHSAISETPISALVEAGPAPVVERPDAGPTAFITTRTVRPVGGTTVRDTGVTPRPFTTTTTRP